MKKILKLIYKTNKKYFHDLMVNDFLEEVPDKVTDVAISILAEKRSKVLKWLLYQAYWLQRRNVSDIETKDKIFGMLLQIKAMYHLVSNTKPGVEEDKTYGETKPISTIEKDLESVDKFVKRNK